MSENHEQSSRKPELATQPFFYEIHVKTRLSEDKWTSWFDNLMIDANDGETILKGTLPDRSALYGLLNRLRDLAIPLESVNVLDAEAQRMLLARTRRYDLLTHMLLIVIYLMFLGGLIALTTILVSAVHPALAMTLLFAALGGVAYALYLWSGARIWRNVSYLMWPSTFLTFFIYLAVAELVHPALAIAMLLLIGAGGLVYLVYYLRRRSDKVNHVLVDWQKLSRNSEIPGSGRPKEPSNQE